MPIINPPLPDPGQPRGQEENDVRAALQAIINLINGGLDQANVSAALAQQFVPVGTVLPFAGGTAPTGYLLCDGSEVSRTTYASLFNVIGTSYGAGNGSTTFNLPDLKGRVPVGVGSHAEVNARGKNEGRPDAFRAQSHTHTTPDHTHSIPSHTHSVPNHEHVLRSPLNFTGGQNPYPEHPVLQMARDLRSMSTNIASGNSYGYSLIIERGTTREAGRIWLVPTDNSPVGQVFYHTEPSGATTTGAWSGTTGGSGGLITNSYQQPFITVNFIIKY